MKAKNTQIAQSLIVAWTGGKEKITFKPHQKEN